MCHSPAATAVCIPGDPRSVIVPRRPDRILVDHSRLINNAKYSRLVEPHRLAPTTKRSVLVPVMKRDHPPSSAAPMDHVFQVRFTIICKAVSVCHTLTTSVPFQHLDKFPIFFKISSWKHYIWWTWMSKHRPNILKQNFFIKVQDLGRSRLAQYSHNGFSPVVEARNWNLRPVRSGLIQHVVPFSVGWPSSIAYLIKLSYE